MARWLLGKIDAGDSEARTPDGRPAANSRADAALEEINGKRREFARQAQHFEQLRRGFVEDVERRKTEERQKFLRDLRAIVAKIAKARNLDLVVQEAVYAGRSVDITDQVLKALDEAENAAAAPN